MVKVNYYMYTVQCTLQKDNNYQKMALQTTMYPPKFDLGALWWSID